MAEMVGDEAGHKIAKRWGQASVERRAEVARSASPTLLFRCGGRRRGNGRRPVEEERQRGRGVLRRTRSDDHH